MIQGGIKLSLATILLLEKTKLPAGLHQVRGADAHQAQNLPLLLGEIAQATRRQASMRMRVDAGRAKTYASARSMVVITGAMAVALTTMSPAFMAPYDTGWGQVVLAIVGTLFAGAVWGLIVMSRPVAEPRVLAGVERRGATE